MSEAIRAGASALAKILALSVAVYVWVFYLRLGWLLPVAWLAGCGAAVYVTARERARLRSRVLGVVAALLAYNAVQFAVFDAATTRTEQTAAMRWTLEESELGPEVALQFEQFPGHFVGFYSGDLAQYLGSREGDQVEALFVVSRALGCMRGYRVARVGELERWETSARGYSRATTDQGEPWPDPFWCP